MFISAGYENNINTSKVVAVVNPSSQPVKRLIRGAKSMQLLVDVTEGNKTASVVVMESGHVILSARKPETIINRIKSKKNNKI